MLTMDELSVIALYVGATKQETERNMYSVSVAKIDDPDVKELFFNARRKLRSMSEEEYDQLDFNDALIADDEV